MLYKMMNLQFPVVLPEVANIDRVLCDKEGVFLTIDRREGAANDFTKFFCNLMSISFLISYITPGKAW